MSLAEAALRIATVQALRAGVAGVKVRDSENGPIDEAALGQPTPFVVVYTDDGEAEGLFDAGTIGLVIEIAVSSRMKPSAAEIAEGVPADAVAWMPAETDAGLELKVNAIGRQIATALAHHDSDWAQWWRRFAMVSHRKVQRGSSARDGVRFAGRQIILTVATLADPTPGKANAAGSIWGDFLALAAATPDTASLAPMLTALVAGGAMTPEWRHAMTAHALAQTTADALLITPTAGATMPDFDGATVDPLTPHPAPIGEVV